MASKEKKLEDPKEYIKKAKITKKFQFYGFFKNLQFFEPFLLLIFIDWGLSLLQIGVLFAIQEVLTYLFEIPSGFLADKYGKKKELLACFVFYIISFIFYFFGPNFIILIVGASFYGLGESFRSGTHKAMEIQWLEKENLLEYKSYLYGRTRAWSLYGSAINAILAIVFVLFLKSDKFIFLLATIPFVLDFLLILSYPNYMDKAKIYSEADKKLSFFGLFKNHFKELGKFFKTHPHFRKAIFGSSLNQSVFKSIKHYIQPIMQLMIAVLILELSLSESTISEDDMIKLFLGITYCLFYLFSSFASTNAYRLTEHFKSSKKTMDVEFFAFGIIILLISLFMYIEIPVIIIILYLFSYMAFNIYRPVSVGYIGELAPKDKRVTILSVESQFKAVFTFILAPLFGFIADETSIELLFLLIGIGFIAINFIFKGDIRDSVEES